MSKQEELEAKINALCAGLEDLRQNRLDIAEYLRAPTLSLDALERKIDALSVSVSERTAGYRFDPTAGYRFDPTARPHLYSAMLLSEVHGRTVGFPPGHAHRQQIDQANACWSALMLPGTTKTFRAYAYLPIGRGWLIALNGGLVSKVIVGDMAQQLPIDNESLGPVQVLQEPIAVGMQFGFTLHAGIE